MTARRRALACGQADMPIAPLVYVASPVSTYRMPAYDRLVCRIQARFPASDLILARDAYSSNADWRARWDGTLRLIDVLVFFPASDGTIGAGVMREVTDALARRVPVAYLDADGTFHPASRVTFAPLRSATARRCVRVTSTGHSRTRRVS